MAELSDRDLVQIWTAGVNAVDSAALVRGVIHRSGSSLTIAGESFDLSGIDRLLVLGGGKAGAGMAAGLEAALGPELVAEKVTGWLNVPADCVRTLQKIHLHAGRPAGLNEPTAEGVAGTTEILRLTASMTDRDVLIALLSGGGSALLPAPIDGLALADKQVLTQQLMQAGATIEQLNAIRSCLSRFKGGGWLRAIPAGRGIALIISDVRGDPLSVIASGPTMATQPDPIAAKQMLVDLLPATELRERIEQRLAALSASETTPAVLVPFRNVIIGNNRTAVDAAAQRASELGYRVVQQTCDEGGIAREVGQQFAEACLHWRAQLKPGERVCLISGGEPTVKLVPTDLPRKGGRNQELVLAAAMRLWQEPLDGIEFLSGGTDGEDGPTDAAGAFFDESIYREARKRGLNPQDYLAINNAYPFFAASHGLLKSGPTHTNVMDLRVALVTHSA
ncbi:DUF4147 domain-containing protein [bacterium]|nr:DUF4147 domain-containing protein [bacterium]